MKIVKSIAFLCILLPLSGTVTAQESLQSWNNGDVRTAIESFVSQVTNPDGPGFVPPSERVAVFDNDGTLWSEQPMYVQMAFVMDRVKALAPMHPEWKELSPFKDVLADDLEAVAASGERGLLELVTATHAGMTTEEFASIVRQWMSATKHPIYNRSYTDCVYQPMLELLDYLREHEFQIYIVSGGGVEFMRPWVEEIYHVPTDRVIGSSIKVKYEIRDGLPVLVRLPQIDFIDDKSEKPVGIHRFIGRRPILAVGNSDGDYEMLEYATSKQSNSDDMIPRLGVIIHHTDDVREKAYDRKSHFGRLNRGLDDAVRNGWSVVDMKRDWKTVFGN